LKPLKFAIDRSEQIQPMLKNVAELILKGLAAGKVILTLGRESRSERQNRLFHKLIGEIEQQADLGQRFEFEAWKAKLVDEFEQELARNGEKLSKPSRITLSFDGLRAITIRASTKDFGIKRGNEFIEFLFAWGAQNGVVFRHDIDGYERELQKEDWRLAA